MTVLERKPLGQSLIGRGWIQPQQLELALREQRTNNLRKLLGEIVVEQKFCSEAQVAQTLAESYGVPFARVSPRLADPQIVCLLPKDFLETQQVIPLFLVEGVLTVAMAEPANVFLPEEIERLTGHRVQVVASPAADIQATLEAYLPGERMFVVEDFAADLTAEEFAVVVPPVKSAASAAGDATGGTEPPVIRLVNACLFGALDEGASDVHFEPGHDELRVRYRIDGTLVQRMSPPPRMRDAVAARLRALAGLEASARRLPQEGSIRATFRSRPITFRVNLMPGHHGETIVLHLAEDDHGAPRLERLGFGYETLKQWRKLIARPSGLVLVVGPSGSGKRDTLYSSLHERRSADLNLCAIEDPVEQTLAGVNQFQVDEKGGFTFPAALRALLRQEPDVLMVSWMRDGETARLAAQAAMTGRLVLGALHATDAPSTLTRLINLGVEPYVVGATVAGVLAQRLVRRLCPACKESYQPAASERRQIERFVGPCETLYRARGCERCHRVGYLSRIGIHELLIPDDALAERISQSAPLAELRELAAKAGMKSLRVDGLEKVKSGITTLDEVYRVTV